IGFDLELAEPFIAKPQRPQPVLVVGFLGRAAKQQLECFLVALAGVAEAELLYAYVADADQSRGKVAFRPAAVWGCRGSASGNVPPCLKAGQRRVVIVKQERGLAEVMRCDLEPAQGFTVRRLCADESLGEIAKPREALPGSGDLPLLDAQRADHLDAVQHAVQHVGVRASSIRKRIQHL